MKLDRGEVDGMLHIAESAERTGFLMCNVAPHRLAALCRLALEVMDAPVATVEWQRDAGMVLGSCRLSSDLVGQRVRLVRVGEGS